MRPNNSEASDLLIDAKEKYMFQKTTVPLIFMIILLLIQRACIPFGDSWVQFSGHVKDTEGKPIKGAQIKNLV